ncbi:hypothetical protein HYN69_05005 [Gemmobacter aquarius]|uniref:RDD family protein n=1 Tax=Paragemmobacter aquarius TaxID=2169400 RepID=A0A2S0UJF5_9RHOB|nr:hypothetical protein [Gemmobacter aquarius]AWB47958.1 hypothetical protein HYN69_05005 [Gemmobacter aquarius]
MSSPTTALPPPSPPPLPPRLFWRRIFAFLVDLTLASALSFALLVALPLPAWVHPGSLPFAPVKTMCTKATIAASGLAPQRIAASGFCTALSVGAPDLHSAFLIFDAVQTENTSSRKSVSYFIDPTTGRFQPTLQPQTFLCLVLLALISGHLHRKGRASPGKWLLGLRVTGLRVAGPAGLRRETLRLAPLLIAAVLALPATILAPETLFALMDRPLAATLGMIATLALTGLALVWFWYDFFPLRWKGALRHDRLCATAVIRARKA